MSDVRFDEVEGEVLEQPEAAPSFDEVPGQVLGTASAPNDQRAKENQYLQQLFATPLGNPDKKAEVLRLVRETGMPGDAVLSNYEQLVATQEAARVDPEKWSRENPELRSLVLANSPASEVVLKDQELHWGIRALRSIGTAMDVLASGIKASGASGRQALLAGQAPGALDSETQGAMAKASAKPRAEALGGLETIRALANNEVRQDLVLDPSASQNTGAAVGAAWDVGTARLKHSFHGFMVGLGRQLGVDTTTDELAAAELERTLRPRSYGEGALRGLLTAAAEQAPQQAVNMAATAATAGAVVATGGMALAPAALIAGQVVGGSVSALQETGSMYWELEKAKKDDGTYLSENERFGTALVYGVVAGAIEQFALPHQVASLGPMGEAFLAGKGKQWILEESRKQGFRAVATKAATEYAKGVAGEGLEEFAQALAADLSKYLGLTVSAGQWQDGKVFDFAGALEEAGMVVPSMLLLGAGGPAVAATSQLVEGARAKRAGQQVAVLAGIASTPSAKAAPVEVAQAIREATQRNGGVAPESLYVDAAEVGKYFQAQGVDPVAGLSELLPDRDGDFALAEAELTGGQVEVPLEVYLERWGPSGVAKDLAPHTTTTPGLTTAAQNELAAKEAARLAEEYEGDNAPASSGLEEDAFIADATAQLAADPRWKKADAKKALAFWRAFIHTASKRFGLPVAELFKNERASISSQGLPSPDDLSFNFGANADGRAVAEGQDEGAVDSPASTAPSAEVLPEVEAPSEAESVYPPSWSPADAEQIALVQQLASRMRNERKRTQTLSWLEYVQKVPKYLHDADLAKERPTIEPALERELAKYGLIDPVHGYQYRDDGRDMARPLPGSRRSKGGEQPAALRAARMERINESLGVVSTYDNTYRQDPKNTASASQFLTDYFLKQDQSTPEGVAARQRDFFIDSTTGVLNERAWKRLDAAGRQVAVISVEGVKYRNDSAGHEAGNDVFRAAARALVDAGAKELAKVGGDFAIYVKDQAELERLLKKASGKQVLQGHGLAGDFAGNLRDASALNNANKAAAEKAGTRAERGQRPKVATGDVSAKPVANTPISQALKDALASIKDEKAIFDEMFIEASTGLLTKDGLDRLPAKKFRANLDLNGLKEFNFLGEALGDELLLRFGNALRELGGAEFDAAHISGDEYALQGDDEQALKAFVEKAKAAAALAAIDLRINPAIIQANLVRVGAPAEDRAAADRLLSIPGGLAQVAGLHFGAGVGKNIDDAEQALIADKQRLAAEGLRGPGTALARVVGRSPATGEGGDSRGGGDSRARNLGRRRDLAEEGRQRFLGRAQEVARFEQSPKNLLVQHNLTAENLLHADKQGGLAAPSLAVGKKEHPLEDFGEITLLAPPSTVDPTTGTPTFDADVYSPRYPETRHDLKAKPLKALESWLEPLAKEAGASTSELRESLSKHGASAVGDSRDVRAALELAWLREKGQEVSLPQEPLRLRFGASGTEAVQRFFKERGFRRSFEAGDGYHQAMSAAVEEGLRAREAEIAKGDPELAKEVYDAERKELLGEDGLIPLGRADALVRDAERVGKTSVDKYKTEDTLREAVDKLGRDEFQQWAEEKLAPALGDSKIIRRTESGNVRRIPHTLENVLKELTRKIRQGEDFNYGLGTARAAGAKKFRSLEQIQKARDKVVASGEFKKLKDEMDKRFVQLAEELGQYNKHVSGFGSLDALATAIGESYKRGHYISQELERSGYTGVPAELRTKVANFSADLLAMPTEYFEAKPQRAVHLGEFVSAVVPEGTSERALEVLRKHGLNIETYKKDEEGSRQKAIAAAAEKANVLFQVKKQTDTPEFKRWFGDSKVVDAEGKPLRVYHGAKRSDRMGPVIKKSRATSGPMPYFTDNPMVASNYATSKSDTSLETPDDYSGWFKLKVGRSEVTIDRAWWFLTPEQRSALLQRLPDVQENETSREVEYVEGSGGPGGRQHWDWTLKEARGNALKAAVELWLNSGILFNDEEQFIKVLEVAGLTGVKFDSPHAEFPGVLPVYLSMQNPLNTREVTPEIVAALEKASRKQRAPKGGGADHWHKVNRDAREWVAALKEDVAKGENSHAWTSIPDWVTKTLKGLGYDGIHDRGNKSGKNTDHDVFIPFEPGQVKSATGNRGTFDPKSANILRQGDDEEQARGYTAILRKGRERIFRIVLNEGADYSTFVHESAHVFLELFQTMAERPDAPERLRQDWADARKWMGVEEGKPLQREHHEKFARGFEKYVAEGKAPSNALVRTFERFKLWMKEVYASLKSLDVELDDSIRSVFDRLLASDEEIARAQKRSGALRTLFRSPEEAGMSPEEWAEYLKAAEEGASNVVRRAELTALQDRQRENEGWWKEKLEEAAKEAEAEYANLPAVQLAARAKGFEFDHAATVEALGEEGAKKVATVKEDGLLPDVAAELWGYPTGKQVLEALASVPGRKEWVQQRAEALMRERYPSVLEDRTQLREAIEKELSSTFTERWLVRELHAVRAKARKDGQAVGPAPHLEAIRLAARQIVDKRKVGKLAPGNALRAERAASDKALAAATRGEWGKAAVHKQQQLLNLYVHRYLLEAVEERARFEKLATRLSKEKAKQRLGKAGRVYLGGVEALLEGLGLQEEDTGRDWPLPSMGEVVAALETDGATISFEADKVASLLGMPWKALTVAELRQAHSALANLEGAARTKSTTLIDGKRMEKEEVVAHLLAEANSSGLKHQGAYVEPGARTPWERVRYGWNNYVGFQRAPAEMVRLLGGDNTTSWWFKAFTLPLREAKAREADLLRQHGQGIVEALEKVYRTNRGGKLLDGRALFPNHRQDLEPPRTVAELMVVLLHAGTESSLSRLTEGRGITVEQLRAAVDKELTADEVGLVREVWQAFEGTWPMMADMEEHLTGVRPQKLTPVPFTTVHGELPGGYFPAVYVGAVEPVGQRQEAQVMADLFDPSYSRPGTPHSHLKSRVAGFTGALSLDPFLISRHLFQALHDVAFREALLSVGGLLLDKDVQNALRVRLGEGYRKQLLPWLKDVAGQRGSSMDELARANMLVKALRWVKGNTTVAVLGYSIPHALENFTNLPAAMFRTQLKPPYAARALAELADPRSTMELLAWVKEKSGELRSADQRLQHKLTTLPQRLASAAWLKPFRFAKDMAFHWQEMTDSLALAVVWLGCYRQATAEGKSDSEAVRFSDDQVQKMAVPKSPVDQASILRDKGVVGFLMQFGGWLSTHFNALASAFGSLARSSSFKDRAATAGNLLGYLVVVGALASWIRGQGPEGEEPEDWAEWFTRKTLLGLISGDAVGREISSAIEQRLTEKRYVDRVPAHISLGRPLVAAGEAAYNAAAALAEGEEIDEATLKKLGRGLGPVTGMPFGGVERSVDYVSRPFRER